MAYDAELAERVRAAVAERAPVEMKKMFGGVCYLVHGHMACGVVDQDLIVRVGPEAYEAALSRAGAREFDMTGRPMKGWVVVGSKAIAGEKALQAWVGQGVAFALGLPPK